MAVLGIDIGSTYIKFSILDLETQAIQSAAHIPTPDFIDKTGLNREIPIQALADLVKGEIDSIATTQSLQGILFSVQMHGFLLFGENGTPLTNYVSWQDMRASHFSDGQDTAEYIRSFVPASLFEENGIILKNTHSLCPLFCYAKETGLSGKPQFALIGDALIRLLTGTVAPVHSTQAASTGLYSLLQKDWNRDLIALLGLNQVTFPIVYDGQTPAAFYQVGEQQIPIFTAVGDHQAAVLGTDAQDNDAIINIGTGGQICYVDQGLHFGDYETRPFFYGRTVRALTQLPSGRALAVLMEFIMEIGKSVFHVPNLAESAEAEVWRTIEYLAQTAADAQGGADLNVDLSFFEPPASERGFIMGINSSNLQPGKLFYGAYAYMAREYYKAFQLLLPDAREEVKSIVFTGGVIRKSPLLQQLIQQQFKIPCHPAPYEDDTMMGLLRLAVWYTQDGHMPESKT